MSRFSSSKLQQAESLRPLLLLLLIFTCNIYSPNCFATISLEQARIVFPQAASVARGRGEVEASLVNYKSKPAGYAFSTSVVSPVSGYSGKPINTLVGIDMSGQITGVQILDHEEPILVLGIGDNELQNFVKQFVGKHYTDRIRVGAHNRQGYVGIDGITGATITTMVIASSVNSAMHKVAAAYLNPAATESAVTANPGSPEAQLQEEQADWVFLWQQRQIEIVIVMLALGFLLSILFFQDWLVKRKKLFIKVRTGYLIFTVFFIGFYCSAQLSVVNVLAFFHSLTGGFSWDTLLIEPIVFLLWGFVAVSILLWGRGVYCGWLCPFGAAQDLINQVARKLGIDGFSFPHLVHERLWAVKYFILIALVGLSLDSMSNAARLAEVEPFKTVFVLNFDRPPAYLFYAIALLLFSALNSKFFCKYLCPLGASLSFATRFRIFDWLRRRNECGHPCQTCAHQCQIGAIKPTGEIIDNECHYCLECQVTYLDQHKCPPLVEKRKRREKRNAKAEKIIASES